MKWREGQDDSSSGQDQMFQVPKWICICSRENWVFLRTDRGTAMQPYPWEHVCSDSHPEPPSILIAPSLSSTSDGGVQICRNDYIFLQTPPPRWGLWKRSCLNHPESTRKAVSQLIRACIKGTLWAQWTSWEAFWRPEVYRSVLWWLGTMDQFWIRWYFGSSKTSPRDIKETRFTTIPSFWGQAGIMGARQEAASPMSSSFQGSRNT